jgi:NAD(P)-dependent dehydrogenase (short-subunit alcohol dehydrogenase family)
MDKGVVLVVGAGGDVGRGVVAAALQSGRKVVAAGRSAGTLAQLAELNSSGGLATVQGDLASETAALNLWNAASAAFGSITDVVVAVNAPSALGGLAELSVDDLAAILAGNVLTHFVAAKTFLPRLPQSGMFIGIGGGTADFIFPGMVPASMSQAALRMLYRGLAKERKAGAQLRELMIVSMVAGQSNRNTAQGDWVTDLDVGRHVCAVLDEPTRFPKPVLHLRSRAQAGHPEAEA